MNPRLIFAEVARNRELMEGHLKTLMDLKTSGNSRIPDMAAGNSVADILDSTFTSHLKGALEAIAAISDSQASITHKPSTQTEADISPVIEADFEEI